MAENLNAKNMHTALVTQRKSRPSIIQSWVPNSRRQHRYTLSNLGITKPATTKQVLRIHNWPESQTTHDNPQTEIQNAKHVCNISPRFGCIQRLHCVLCYAKKKKKTLLESARVCVWDDLSNTVYSKHSNTTAASVHSHRVPFNAVHQ